MEVFNYSNEFKSISASQWDYLANKRIFFGHQSVGYNIVQGMEDILRDNQQIKLTVIENAQQGQTGQASFAHSRVGRNEDPESKMLDFALKMDEGVGKGSDIAFFKLCYIDINPSTDIQKAFSLYKNTMDRLKTKYPDVTFVHVTTPLGVSAANWKTMIKELLGKEIWAYETNIARNRYNDLIREEYKGKEPIFDLARIESTYPDGKRSSFTKSGETYYSLVPGYTYDYGHLNETGRRIVAQELLIFLANVAEVHTKQ